MFSGQWEYTSYDFMKVARNITTVNRVYNTWVAANYGEVRRRSDGSTVLTDLDPGDVFAAALGIPLQETELAYTINYFQKDSDEHVKEHAKKMREMKRIMLNYIDKGDLVSAKEVGDDITAMWWMLTPYNQDRVFKQLSYGEEDFFESIMLRELRRGHSSPLTDAGRNLLNGGT
jgi:hypothetical protein